MKKLLLAGGSHADIPLIQAAKALGYQVTTSGNRPEDFGHRVSDAYVPCDYSNPLAILDLARSLGVDALCACCNDFSALSCAYAAAALGLPGHDTPETAALIHHKDRWRAFAKRHAIPSPRAFGCNDLAAVERVLPQLRFPLIIKPVDLTGGKGIARVVAPEDALTAARAALGISKAKRIVVEEFIIGSRHGFTALLRDQRVVFHFTDDEHYHLSPYLVSAASAPTSCSSASIDRLVEYSEAIARDLRLVDGVFHVQFIQCGEGDPVIIEICRRAPGDLYVELVRHATGAPYAEWIVRAACGLGISQAHPMPVRHCITRHCLMADRPGTFVGFDFDPVTEAAIIDRMIWARAGDDVSDPNTHKFGIVFVEHPDQEQMQAQAPRLQALLAARMRP